MFRSVLDVSLTCIHPHLKIPFMIFPDFLTPSQRDARQTCIETQKGVAKSLPNLAVIVILQKRGFLSLPPPTLDIHSPGLGI